MSIPNPRPLRRHLAALAVLALALFAPAAQAEIDGHGPDAWRVTGVSANDTLNVRMGPGTNYPVIEQFAHNERGLEQITCVPYYTLAHYSAMSEAQIKALPPRWCLMRDAAMMRAGWVAQRYITPDNATPVPSQTEIQSNSTDPMIVDALTLVGDLYNLFEQSQSAADNPFLPPTAERFFFAAIVPDLAGHGADVLYDAQDFMGAVTRIAPDEDHPMLRGMITINVDFTNFGQARRAVFSLRPDPAQQGAPVRIFRVDHAGWSFP